MAGSRPSRRCGSAARSTRNALHSVPSIAFCQAASSRSSNRPGGGPPELTTSRSSPPKAATAARDRGRGPSGVDRSAGHGQRAETAGLGVQPFAAARDEADLCALVAEDRRDRAAETAAAATDERPRAVESEVHRLMVAARA